jgi:hypothetical protein
VRRRQRAQRGRQVSITLWLVDNISSHNDIKVGRRQGRGAGSGSCCGGSLREAFHRRRWRSGAPDSRL